VAGNSGPDDMMLRYNVHLAKNVEDNLENPHDGEFLYRSFRETEYLLNGGTTVAWTVK